MTAEPGIRIGTHVRGSLPVGGGEVAGYYYGTTRHGLHIVYGERWSGDADQMPRHQWLLAQVEPAPEEEEAMPLDGVERAAAAVAKGRTTSEREDIMAVHVAEISKRHKKGRGPVREAINIRVAALEEQTRQRRAQVRAGRATPPTRAGKAPRGGPVTDGAAFQAVLDKHGIGTSALSAAAVRGELFIDQPVSNRYVWLVTHKGGSAALLERFAAAVEAYAALQVEG